MNDVREALSPEAIELIPVLNKVSGKSPEFGFAPFAEKFNLEMLAEQMDNKDVTAKTKDNFTIYKYGDVTPFVQHWNEVTLRTRGLIVDNDSGNIVARGFNKFFNYQELIKHGIEVDINEEALIMDKVDGSMGIAFKWNDKWIVSTPGSLNSNEARHATKIMNDRYSHVPYTPGKSLIFEIVSPINKIVTDYKGLDDLILLGATDINGHWISPEEITEWDGLRTNVRTGTIKQALSVPDPEDASEGFVVRTNSGLMLKIKFPHYLKLHRAKFSITPKVVWHSLRDNSYNELIAGVPDEFYTDVKKFHDDIMSKFDSIMAEVDAFGATFPPELSGQELHDWVMSQPGDKNIRLLALAKFKARKNIDLKVLALAKPFGGRY